MFRGPYKRRHTLEDLFLKKVEARVGGCWRWTASMRPNGYGAFQHDGIYAHRWAYRHWIGEIPKGLELDHLCRNRWCVNPTHLEPVTRRENLLRSPLFVGNRSATRTHCPNGHPYDEANTYAIPGKVHRLCRECRRTRNREAERRKRANERVARLAAAEASREAAQA